MNIRVLRLCSWLVLGVMILACATNAQAKTSLVSAPKDFDLITKTTPDILRGKIIFLRDADVWMFDPITRRQQILFSDKKDFWVRIKSDHGFDFSPDLRSLVVQSFRADFIGNDLSIINLKTGEEKKLVVSAPEIDFIEPRFSPDGKKISYTKRTGGHDHFEGDKTEIRMVNFDGSNDFRVIGDESDQSRKDYSNAFWSRDGKRLIYFYSGLDKFEFQTCAPNGSDVKPFDGEYGAWMRPDVSPDGKMRTVAEFHDNQSRDFPLLRLYTSQNRKIRDLVSNNDLIRKANPRWSTDSKRIIFEATRQQTQLDANGYAREVMTNDIWAVSINGKDLRRIIVSGRILTWLH